jgi:DNA-binding GntR family transcriptional regulator
MTTVSFRYARAARSFEEHRQLLAALRARDEREAAKLIKLHLCNAAKFNAELWERQQPS